MLYAMEYTRVKKALDKINVPVYYLDTEYTREDVGQMKTRVEAFLEMLTARVDYLINDNCRNGPGHSKSKSSSPKRRRSRGQWRKRSQDLTQPKPPSKQSNEALKKAGLKQSDVAYFVATGSAMDYGALR